MSISEQANPKKIRILLAEGHSQLRGQLTARLQRETDFEVVAVTANSLQTLKEARAKQPDLLLIDPFMGDGLGLATIRQLRTDLSPIVIVVLTAIIDTMLTTALQEMGVRHILAKGVLSSHLLSELRAAAKDSTQSLDS